MTPRPSASIRVAVIVGTNRPGNYTKKAAALVIDELRTQSDVDVDVIDGGEVALLPPELGSAEDITAMRERVAAATAVVVATPEYHGSFSAITKLFIENLGFPSALKGKPVALLGVAAGQIGAVKSLEHLQGVCLHVGGIVLPGSVSVANVKRAFDESGRCLDAKVEGRVRGLAQNVLKYIRHAVCPALELEAMVREG